MNSAELKERYQRFFEARGHRRLPSAPLLPENDPSALFISAGMQPLVPFLLGERHPQGRRLVNTQRSLRTNDIDEVGDAAHLTFFEMLGNWSLGDYFKAEALAWSYEFLTQALGIDPGRLAVTVFAGDENAPRDDESAEIWRALGLPKERIHFLPKRDNWWGPVGPAGPCGPDSEIFYDTGAGEAAGAPHACRPGCGCGRWLEIWNNVFMEYRQRPDGRLEKLAQRNVDTGMGVERTAAVLSGHRDVFAADTLRPLVERLEALTGQRYADDPRPLRIIADHVRAASMAIADGAVPSNVEAGYVVRRMLRRAIRHGRALGLTENFTRALSGVALDLYADAYPALTTSERRQHVAEAMEAEETKFKRTLERGLRQYDKVARGAREGGEKRIAGADAFDLFETYGFPLALTEEMAREEGLSVDRSGFEARYAEHQAASRRGVQSRFQGGLADQSEATTRLHTATHLLHAALRRVLGPGVQQKGSNITPERLRFDFTHGARLSPDELRQVEDLVNEQIAADVPVAMEVMPLEQALATGALAFFGEKYGEEVKVYTLGAFSKEVCGGPHARRTGELGRLRVIKEEAVGQGVRRIRAVLEPDGGRSAGRGGAADQA